MEVVSTINQLNDIQIQLEKILNNCRNLSLPYEQIRTSLERYRKRNEKIYFYLRNIFRIDHLNLRIDNLYTQLTPLSSSSVMKISSPTTTRILDSSSVTTPSTNGFHYSSKRQVNNIKKKSYANNFVLIDENKCRFFFSILPIPILNVVFFTRDKREPTVIFLRLQFSLIRIQFVVVVQYLYTARFDFFLHSFELLNIPYA